MLTLTFHKGERCVVFGAGARAMSGLIMEDKTFQITLPPEDRPDGFSCLWSFDCLAPDGSKTLSVACSREGPVTRPELGTILDVSPKGVIRNRRLHWHYPDINRRRSLIATCLWDSRLALRAYRAAQKAAIDAETQRPTSPPETETRPISCIVLGRAGLGGAEEARRRSNERLRDYIAEDPLAALNPNPYDI
jgi:hypothetical protein